MKHLRRSTVIVALLVVGLVVGACRTSKSKPADAETREDPRRLAVGAGEGEDVDLRRVSEGVVGDDAQALGRADRVARGGDGEHLGVSREVQDL